MYTVLIVITRPMSSAALPSRGQCIEVTDNLQLRQCLSFVSTLDHIGPGSSSPGISRAQVLLEHLRSVWTWYSRACRLHFNVRPSVRCDELRCALSEGRCSPVVMSAITFMHPTVDAPGTSMHMLGISHRAHVSRERVSFACYSTQC